MIQFSHEANDAWIHSITRAKKSDTSDREVG